jgi:hypothetical protein
MKVSASIFFGLFCAVSTSLGQNNSGTGVDSVPPLPRTLCRFERTHANVMRVKEVAPPDFSASFEKAIRFPVNTVVSVSRREQSWSCVTGSIQTPNGWSTQTGWMQSSQLEELPN